MNRIGPQPGCYGAWVLCAVPAVLASGCLVTILCSGLGRWTVPAVAGWLLAGPLLLLGPAERAAGPRPLPIPVPDRSRERGG